MDGTKTDETAAAPTGTNSAVISLTVLTKSHGALSKHISLGKDGKPVPDGSGCKMVTGVAVTMAIPFAHLPLLIEDLRPDQALALGVLKDYEADTQVPIATARSVRSGKAKAGAIARTLDNFVFQQGPGSLLLDIDLKGASPKVRGLIEAAGSPVAAILNAIPALKSAPRAERASTSSGLSNTVTGEVFEGSGGMHVYIAVADAEDITRATKVLHDRLVLAGLGWSMLGRSGAILERSLADRSVGSPERLDFEGAPVIEPPLVQAPRPMSLFNAGAAPINSVVVLPDLTKAEADKLARMRGQQRSILKHEARERRGRWAQERGEEIAKSTGGDAQEIARALMKGDHDPNRLIELPQEMHLEFDSLGVVGLAKVMKDPEAYVGETLADPLEGITYGPGKAMIMAVDAEGNLYINSFAHGGMRYIVKHIAARKPFWIDDKNKWDGVAHSLAALIGQSRTVFASGGSAVKVVRTKSAILKTVLRDEDGEPLLNEDGTPRTEPAHTALAALATTADVHGALLSVATLHKETKDGTESAAPPVQLLGLVQAFMMPDLPPLLGVSTSPVFQNGRLITGHGYSEETALWLETGDLTITPCEDPVVAWQTLSNWLSGFWFERQIDKVIAVASLLDLLTVKSALMSTAGAPLTFVAGAGSGVGKSQLVSVLGTAAFGKPSPVMTYPVNPEEREKVLFTAMREGTPHVAFDNFTANGSLGHGHDALLKVLSESEGKGRVLGESKSYEGPLAAKITMTGISPSISGEMIRRTLVASLRRPDDDKEVKAVLAKRAQMPNLIKWTANERGVLLGAAECILQQKATIKVEGYEDWGRIVAGPLMAAVNMAAKEMAEFVTPMTEDDLVGAWRDVLEDGTGYVRKGSDKLVAQMHAKLGWGGKPDDPVRVSAPFTARTILRLCESGLISGACFDAEPDQRIVQRWIDNQIGVAFAIGKEQVRMVKHDRRNLGDDTDHKVRQTWMLVSRKDQQAQGGLGLVMS